MRKVIVISLLIFTLFGCYSTHGNFLTSNYDAWIDGYSQDKGGSSGSDKGLMFCRANIKSDGGADPICFVPRFKENLIESVNFKK